MLPRLGGVPRTIVEETPEKPISKRPNWVLLSICLGAVVTIVVAILVSTWKGLLITLGILFLFAIYPVVCLIRWTVVESHSNHKTELALRFAALAIVAVGLIYWARRSRPALPLIAIQISPSNLPISIPAHSVASALQIHPYIVPTAEKDWLLKIANDTGKEGCWPSQKELDSMGPNGHETVYRVEIGNHSHQTLTSGKIVFRLKYNKGSGPTGGCMPPSDAKDDQEDVVLLPPLDPGKSFEFFAVNQSNLCAWLIPPSSATVVMDEDQKEKQATLTFDKDPLYAMGAPVFSPTAVEWEGVPARPGGYGIVRTEVRSCERKKGNQE